MQWNTEGNLVLSVADPFVDFEKDTKSPRHGFSKDRQIRIRFSDATKFNLLSSRYGLPQTDPPLDVPLTNNVLTFTTRNGVTDTFVVSKNK